MKLRSISVLLAVIFSAISLLADGGVMCVFGDSYVRNHRCPVSETWHAKVAVRLGLKYVNCGVNGNCVAFDRTDEGYGRAMVDRVDELPDSADVIIIIAGHNDAGMIAHVKDCSIEQFSLNLDRMLKSLRSSYPDAAIGYVTPWHVDRAGFAEVISEIRRVCADNAVPVLDSASCGIDVNNVKFRERYFQGINDTAHLNNDGHDLLVGWGLTFVESLLP